MSGHPRRELDRATLAVVVLTCGLTYMFDGYDLTVFGATLPSLLDHWRIGPAQAGAIGSYALVGMLIGALVVGSVTDVLGRRKVLIGTVTWFSVMTALCAVAPGPEVFGVLRFLAGLGLGGVLPTLNALVVEYAPARHRNLTYVVMAMGYPLGGLLAAGLAIPLIPALGWQVMYLIGAAPLALVLPLALRRLPESLEYLVASGRTAEAEALAARLGVDLPDATTDGIGAVGGRIPVRALLRRDLLVATPLFWVTAFCSLLLIYGLNTWLPQLMRQAGYPLGSALSFLLVFNLGAIVGMVFGGRLADRLGSTLAVASGFLLAALAVALLAFGPDPVLLYLLLAVGGYGTMGTQALLNAHVTSRYPGPLRSLGIGWTLGVGRLGGILGPVLAGLLVAAGIPLTGIFLVFAAIAVVGAIVITAVPRRSPAPAAAAPVSEHL